MLPLPMWNNGFFNGHPLRNYDVGCLHIYTDTAVWWKEHAWIPFHKMGESVFANLVTDYPLTPPAVDYFLKHHVDGIFDVDHFPSHIMPGPTPLKFTTCLLRGANEDRASTLVHEATHGIYRADSTQEAIIERVSREFFEANKDFSLALLRQYVNR
ncbi:hypothetical protein JXA12_04900 [Candidatus Woesearchaeota archaeon]|nr:hypothetical protein [Candidatus Woesearchaeota archaeon]